MPGRKVAGCRAGKWRDAGPESGGMLTSAARPDTLGCYRHCHETHLLRGFVARFLCAGLAVT